MSDCDAQGLLFYGNEKRINERASYSMFEKGKQPVFSSEFHLSFDYSVHNFESPGYILYLEDRAGGKTYSFTYLPKSDDRCSFSFNEDGKRIFCTFELDKNSFDHHWVPISILLYPQRNEAEISIGTEKKRIYDLGLGEDGFSPLIYFGKCEYILDVASYAIQNLSLSDGKEHWSFPLKESSGEVVHDSKGRATGTVTNPVWLINKSYYWNSLFTNTSSTPSGLNFDSESQKVLVFNQDSLSVFDVYTREFSVTRFRNMLPVHLRLGMNFLDREKEELYAYEVNVDIDGDATVAALNLQTLEWRAVGVGHTMTQLHHHCGFYHPVKKKYILFGGYGSRRYSNSLLAYDVKADHWDTLALSGDRIAPRYFAGMAVTPDYKRMYLYGGMGNESGDQNVGRNYFYDLYQVDMEQRVVRKLWNQEAPAVNRVVARSMVLSDDEKYLYILGYPEYMPNSFLQLYRLSASDGRCEAVGDSIPVASEEIATNANLFFNRKLNEFYCSVQEFEKNGQVNTRLYSLSAPPVTLTAVKYYSDRQRFGRKWIICGLIGFVVLGVAFLWLFRRRKKLREGVEVPDVIPSELPSEVLEEVQEESILLTERVLVFENILPIQRNAVFLFGIFAVLDRDGRDVTYLFSAKLRVIFLYILLNSVSKEGVLSSDMNELFWSDKPDANIKNLKGVTMNHLRKILQEMDGIELVFQKGYFRLVFAEEFYCDYLRFVTLSGDGNQNDFAEVTNTSLNGILSRGKFLATVKSELFDYYRLKVEDFIHSFLPEQIAKAYQNHRFDAAIRLCNILFTADSLSDVALAYTLRAFLKLNKPEEAARRYGMFIKDYKKVMGEDYPIAYSDI